MVTLMLRFSVAPEHRETLRAFLAKALPYYEQPGGIRVRLLRGVDSPTEFLEMVEYRDREAYERDQLRVQNDPVMKALLAEWRQLHVAPVSVEVYHEERIGISREPRPGP